MTKDQFERSRMYEVLKEVADNLKDLYVTVDTIKLGLSQELADRQARAALGTIKQSIKTIWTIAHDAVVEYDEEPDPDELDIETE